MFWGQRWNWTDNDYIVDEHGDYYNVHGTRIVPPPNIAFPPSYVTDSTSPIVMHTNQGGGVAEIEKMIKQMPKNPVGPTATKKKSTDKEDAVRYMSHLYNTISDEISY